MYPNNPTKVPWSSGLFDCFSDIPICCLTLWCPCVTFGRVAGILDRGSPSCLAHGALYTLLGVCSAGFSCLYSCCYRSKMREQYSLEASPCGDCLVHLCFETCALCQEHRELKSRGFDMSIGWHGNVERQNQGVAMGPTPPVFEGAMIR